MTTVLIANPSADVYGADLQMLDSVVGMVEAGMRVVVSLPEDGPLAAMIRDRGAEVRHDRIPVVRRSALSAKGLAALGGRTVAGTVRLARLLRRVRPDVVYVNTMTIPVWISAARLARIPVVCHVHEAEESDSALILKGLHAPLRLATSLIANSRAAIAAMVAVFPSLEHRTRLVYNGIPSTPVAPAPVRTERDGSYTVVAVCRLSPRKAPHVALEAVAALRAEGRDVALTVYGTPFAGYEWYEQQLRDRAGRADLAGAVTFGGYVAPVWDALAAADAVVAPSLREPFGNAVVEAQFARRPVVAAATLGHLETVVEGETGLLVPPDDAPALAAALARLMDDAGLARHVADVGREQAVLRFSVERYRREIAETVAALVR